MREREELVERVRSLPERVAAEIAGLTDEALRWRPAAGGWSINEVCGHLCDDSEVWCRRVSLMATEVDPELPRYDQEALVREREYREAAVASLVSEFRRLRLEIVGLLAGLPPEGWQRRGQHPNWGWVTLEEGIRMMVDHTEGHLDQIRELKKGAAAEG